MFLHILRAATRVAAAALFALIALLATGCDSTDPLREITQPAYVLDESQTLFVFDLANPEVTRRIGPVTGLAAGEQIVGMDFRPARGTLYLLGQTARLYTVNLTTGAAMQAAMLTRGGSPLALSGSHFGVDFNPVPDRLRVISNTGQNLRINVDTGETILDGALAYASGDPGSGTAPQAVAAGYTNSRSGTVSETRLLVLDAGRNTLVLQNPPNDGVLNTLGSLGLDLPATAAFDIRTSGSTNEGFVVAPGASGSELYTINLTTGATSRVGRIGVRGMLRGLAVPTS
ncbi:MAG: DUF4394 domain-containing protein [Rubricoccaceae bacterium]